MSGSGFSWAMSHVSFLQAGCPSCRPTNSVKALKALYNAYKFNRVSKHFSSQINEISETVWRSQMSLPASVVPVEGRSTVEDRRPRNSVHRVYYVFVARAASTCHWNWTAWNITNFSDSSCIQNSHQKWPPVVRLQFAKIVHVFNWNLLRLSCTPVFQLYNCTVCKHSFARLHNFSNNNFAWICMTECGVCLDDQFDHTLCQSYSATVYMGVRT